MTASAQLASWAHSLTLADVPPHVQAAACCHLLDGLGTALAGARAHAADPAVRVATELGGPAESTILGTTVRLSAPAAALANGTLLHALDFDDTHPGGLVHATAGVLPAALAIGEQEGASGVAVLRAAIAGYEVVCRIAAASPHGFHARGIHATHACGVFSAALITCLLTGQSVETTVQAMGIAGSAAGGLLEFLNTGSQTKQLHPGTAALNGILAARLAAAGATGPESVLEGDKGLYAALSGRPASTGTIAAGLGDRWETAVIGIKPYPACQLLHVTLDAVTSVLDQVPDGGQVTDVVADVHPDSSPVVCEPRAAKLAPRTPYEAKFSLPWSVAALLTDRTVGIATYSPASIERPEVGELASRVRVRVTDDHGPAASAVGRAEVGLVGGRVLTGSASARSVPIGQDEVVAKFVANCGGSTTAGSLAGLVLSLGSLPSLQPLLDLSRAIAEEPQG